MALGLREGLLDGIELGLELKFGSEGLRLLPEILEIEDMKVLRAIHEGLKITETMEALRRIYQPGDAEASDLKQILSFHHRLYLTLDGYPTKNQRYQRNPTQNQRKSNVRDAILPYTI